MDQHRSNQRSKRNPPRLPSTVLFLSFRSTPAFFHPIAVPSFYVSCVSRKPIGLQQTRAHSTLPCLYFRRSLMLLRKIRIESIHLRIIRSISILTLFIAKKRNLILYTVRNLSPGLNSFHEKKLYHAQRVHLDNPGFILFLSYSPWTK